VAVAIRPQGLVKPTDEVSTPPVWLSAPKVVAARLITLPTRRGQESHRHANRAPWQDLRLFGRGRHPGSFKAGAEQNGDL
jgi:hypothetical protein